MTLVKEGKFCQSCSKNVIDFTNLSDNEIAKIISNSSGSLCGRLRNDQLNRIISDRKETSCSTLFSKIAASFLLMSLVQQANAKPSKKVNTPIVVSPSEIKKEKNNQESTVIGDSTITVRVKLKDSESKEAIPFANVTVKDSTGFSNISAISNIDGEFQLNVSSQLSIVTIEITYIGYERKTIDLKVDGTLKHEVLMTADTKVLGAIGELEVSKIKWWQVGRRLNSWRYQLAYKWRSTFGYRENNY